MSAKMASVEASMSQLQKTDSVQAKCHEASQPMQGVDQDCCDLQGGCRTMCHVNAVLPSFQTVADLPPSFKMVDAFAASFHSADLRAGFKPPLL